GELPRLQRELPAVPGPHRPVGCGQGPAVGPDDAGDPDALRRLLHFTPRPGNLQRRFHVRCPRVARVKPTQPRGSSQSKRQIAIDANSALKASSTAIGAIAASKPRPRQVMASRPSTAQRVGTTSDAVCSQGGKTNDGTHAP